MINNPSSYASADYLSRIITCSVCNSIYNTKPYHPSWSLRKVINPVLWFVETYCFSILFMLFCFLLFSGLLLIPLIVNSIAFVAAGAGFCYYKGVRPHFFATATGISLGFIRIGEPVEGLCPGVVLSATNMIKDGMFFRARVLITAYDAKIGAVGFILNRRVGVDNLNGRYMHIGGPVDANSRHVIHNYPVQNAKKIAEEIYLGGTIALLPQETLCATFIGYCSWIPLQLDGEIRAGVWTVMGKVNVNDVFF
jgi:putative AlgH/UPF0301 family transcriptional regulator